MSPEERIAMAAAAIDAACKAQNNVPGTEGPVALVVAHALAAIKNALTEIAPAQKEAEHGDA